MWRLPLIYVVVLACAVQARADAKDDFEAVFGAEARRVQGTKETSDDLRFARTLLDHAAKLTDDPQGRALFCMKAYEFALADPLGHIVAKQAMTLLAKDPKQKLVADQKLLEMYQSLYE